MDRRADGGDALPAALMWLVKTQYDRFVSMACRCPVPFITSFFSITSGRRKPAKSGSSEKKATKMEVGVDVLRTWHTHLVSVSTTGEIMFWTLLEKVFYRPNPAHITQPSTKIISQQMASFTLNI